MRIKSQYLNPRKLKRIKRRLKQLPTGFDFFKYSANKLKYMYLTAIKSTKMAYPHSIIIEVTNHCNLKCTTCPLQYDFGKAMDKGLINKNDIYGIIDEVYPYVDNISLTGLGETLINKNLVDILSYIKTKNKGVQTSISTNAHLPKSTEYLKKIIPYLDQLQISIDGVNDVYNNIRIDGDFSFFKETVIQYKSICESYDVPILFNFVIVKENYHQMPDILDLADELGIQYVNMNPLNITSVTNQDISYYDFFRSPNYLEVLNETILKSKTIDNVEFSIYDYKSKNGFKKCIYPWIHNYVTWDGFMVPCCARPFPKEIHYGNVFENGFLTCLNSDGFRSLRSMWFKNETPDFCVECIKCELKPISLDVKVAHA